MVGTARRAPLPTYSPRHCERSDVSAVARRAKAEAIHAAAKKVWIASSQELLAMTEYRVGRWTPSTSLRAQRSNPCRRTKKVWIASSQELLAMTEYRVGRWAPSTSLRAQRSNPYRRTKKVWIASSQELLAMTEYPVGTCAPSTSF